MKPDIKSNTKLNKKNSKSIIGKPVPFLVIILLIILAAVCIPVLYFYIHTMHYTSDDNRRYDIEQINSTAPECLLLSMLPTEGFSAEDFEYYRGTSAIKASHKFENLYDIQNFLTKLDSYPSDVYLAFDPAAIASLYGFHASLYGKAYDNTLLSNIREHRDTSYEILLPYYSLEYWKSLSDSEKENVITAYRDFMNIFYAEPNVTVYFAGAEEWLIANPGNYESENSCNKAVTAKIVALTFSEPSYILTPENMEDKFSLIRDLTDDISSVSLLSEYDLTSVTDLSDMDIVFFGDSVIGNFTDSTSIPGVVAGLSGAKVYNLGVGGTTATFNEDPDALELGTIVEAFLNRDSSRFSYDQQAKYGIEEYAADHSDGIIRPTCFIINYGLNDYFAGMPIDIPWADGETTCYTGAFRSAAAQLMKAYPGCRIILMTPTYCSYYNDGTVPQSSEGGELIDYVDAVCSVADEIGVEYINNYRELGFDRSNYETYLSDGCHPNELGRYVMGRHILLSFY